MKKALAIIVVLLLCATVMFAQNDPADPQAGRNVDVSEQSSGGGGGGNFMFGPKLGIGYSTVRATHRYDLYEPESATGIFAWQIGARLGYFFGMFGIIADFEYIKKGYSIEFPWWNQKLETHMHYLDINLMLAVKASSFYAGIGVYVGFLMSAKQYLTTGGVEKDLGFVDGFNKTDIGLVITLGYKMGMISLGLDFKFGLTELFQENYGEWKYTNWNLFLNIGIMFGG